MKPLATPVLGGMVSSLLHVLLVTPVIFFLLRRRQLGLTGEATRPCRPHPGSRSGKLRRGLAALALVIIVALLGWRFGFQRV